MAGKCPPGVICIENMTVTLVILSILSVFFLFYFINNNSNNRKNNDKNINYNIDIKREDINNNSNQTMFSSLSNLTGLFPRPSFSFSNISNDVLMNPYQPPVRDDRIFQMDYVNSPNKVPINIQTQSVDTNYRQIGILTRIGGKETILPLMGKPLITNRDRWNFYTLSESNNMIKLPITFKNRRCMTEQGCDNIYNGDTVYVEGYNDAFKVTTYDNNVIRYLPYI